MQNPEMNKTAVKNWKSFSNSRLSFDRVLGSFGNGTRVACLCYGSSGSNPEEKERAVVVLEKQPISQPEIEDLLRPKDTGDSLSLVLQNDVYHTFTVTPHPTSNLIALKATVMMPATDQHILKYSGSETVVVTETPQIYNEITKPFIQEKQLGLRWVLNILDGTAEADRVLYSDPDPENGFVLLPDMKWDGMTDPENRLYLVAIMRCPNVHSIRDLTVKHVHMLENVNKAVPEFINTKYGIRANRLRIFFHYLPSYWHLHVHFVVGKFVGDEMTSGGLWSADRAHFLDSVISNIRLISSYYQRATLVYSLRIDSPLYSRLEESNDESN